MQVLVLFEGKIGYGPYPNHEAAEAAIILLIAANGGFYSSDDFTIIDFGGKEMG